MGRGGKGTVFAHRLGLIVIEEKEQDSPKLRDGVKKQSSKAKQFEYLSPFFLETKIALEYLHITHGEFKKLPREERLICIMYEKMKMARDEYYNNKEIAEIKASRIKQTK